MPRSSNLLSICSYGLCVVLLGSLPGLPAQSPDPSRDRIVTMASELLGTHSSLLGGVAVDRLGYTYLADFGEQVWRISPHGDVELIATGLYGAAGNDIDAQGNLWQANHYAGTVLRIGRWGEVTTIKSGLGQPVGLTLNDKGKFFVTDWASNSIRGPGSSSVYARSDLFDRPVDLVWAGNRLFVVSAGNGIVAIVLPRGVVEEFARIPGGGNAGITYGWGSLFVTGLHDNRIYRVSMTGGVEVLGGSGARGAKDGPRLEAELNGPQGIDFMDGALFFNERVQMTGPKGAPQAILSLRKLALPTITDALLLAGSSGRVEDLSKAYAEYLADPLRRGEPIELSASRLADEYARRGALDMAWELLRLNAESHPKSWRAQEHLGAALASAGRSEEAVRAYRRVLKLKPDHEAASQAITELRRRR